MEPTEVVKTLMENNGIFVNAFDHPAVQGVRVTPGLPTSVNEIHRLVDALQAMGRD